MAYAVPTTYIGLSNPVLQDLDVVQSALGDTLGKETLDTLSGRKFKYVVTDASCVASTGGEPAYYMVGTTANEVTSDYSDAQNSEQTGATFAGVFCGTITGGAAEYCWIEVPNGAITADCSLATEVGICDGLVAAHDSYFSIAASFSEHVVAVAMEAASSNLGDIIMLP